MSINAVIAKPTRECNADCTYCAAPPTIGNFWSIETFRRYFDRVSPSLSPNATWVWHGGEPMLLGPDFYISAYEYAKSRHPGIRFSMQTNLLGYSPGRWGNVMANVFGGSVSTSYDPDERLRTVEGSSKLYNTVFKKRLDQFLNDGFSPLVLSVLSDETLEFGLKFLEESLKHEKFSMRFNYVYPAGKGADNASVMTPALYGEFLIKCFDMWASSTGNIDVVPVSQMFDLCLGLDSDRCPWTSNCSSHFLHVDPEGDVYTCGSLADLNDLSLCYGNLSDISDEDVALGAGVSRLLSSQGALKVTKRRLNIPVDCKSCEQFDVCRGGCQRDAALYDRGLGGKFYFCESWLLVFDHIKKRIKSGEISSFIEARYLMKERSVQ